MPGQLLDMLRGEVAFAVEDAEWNGTRAGSRRGDRFVKFSEGDIQAFEQVLMLFLEGENLVVDEGKLVLDFVPGLIFQIGEEGRERQLVDRFPPGCAGRPIELAEAAGQNHLFLFKIGKVLPL